MSDGHNDQVSELVTANRFSVAVMVLIGLVWAILAASIVASGDTAYGLLYTGPMLISFIFAYAVWRQPTHV